ncbi:transposase [Enterococcus sp. BWB1-3]|uniref:RNA-guided endonuclease TnpB family protein n=1 Tax=Enterococcus sp. BWB1-3 TaxID=2787713 RepID=UPI00192346BE|nr:transposase [Enterococcus sp. BWB1-3]
MKVLKAYKYRLYPTPSQIEFFEKNFYSVSLVHNLLLQDRIMQYRASKKNPDLHLKPPTPAKYKKEYPFLKEADSLALANAQVYLERGLKYYYTGKNVGFPKLKSRKNPVTSYTTNNQGGTIKIIGLNCLKIPKLKTFVKVKAHREIKGKIKSATISKTPSGKYFVSLLCEEKIHCKEKTNRAVGISLGQTEFAVLSNGQKIDNDQLTDEIEQRIRREEKKLARKKHLAGTKGLDLLNQKNYQKQKMKVAKLREKLLNQRHDFLNKVTTELIDTYDVICVEDAHKEDFCRNYKLNKRVSDVSWALFVSKLEYKATWHDKQLIKLKKCDEKMAVSLKNGLIGDVDLELAKEDSETDASIQLLLQGLKNK